MRNVRELLSGSIPALITPMHNGAVDERAYQDLIRWQIAEGSHALVPCGTTGESPTLTDSEHRRLVELCVREANGRVPVIAGAGSNSTAHAISLAKSAKDVGADALLAVTGYYNRPSQEGLYHHFATLAEAADMPVVLYNIPGRTVVDISLQTMERLARVANVVGVKDATGNLSRPILERQACGAEWRLFSGDDATALAYMVSGGHGCISVTANIAPRACAIFQEHCIKGDFEAARQMQQKLMPLHVGLFCEPSPGPVKYAASLLGLCHNELRAPMMPLTEAGQRIVRQAMVEAGLL